MHSSGWRTTLLAAEWRASVCGTNSGSVRLSASFSLHIKLTGCVYHYSSTCQADSPIQQFIFNPGPTQIQLLNTSLCVEFGPGLGRNGTPLRLQQCRGKGAPGQRLFITDDNHIALQNGPGQCADVRDGKVVDDVGELQSWRCAADNTNQVL